MAAEAAPAKRAKTTEEAPDEFLEVILWHSDTLKKRFYRMGDLPERLQAGLRATPFKTFLYACNHHLYLEEPAGSIWRELLKTPVPGPDVERVADSADSIVFGCLCQDSHDRNGAIDYARKWPKSAELPYVSPPWITEDRAIWNTPEEVLRWLDEPVKLPPLKAVPRPIVAIVEFAFE
jgi:hypothetical protein